MEICEYRRGYGEFYRDLGDFGFDFAKGIAHTFKDSVIQDDFILGYLTAYGVFVERQLTQ